MKLTKAIIKEMLAKVYLYPDKLSIHKGVVAVVKKSRFMQWSIANRIAIEIEKIFGRDNIEFLEERSYFSGGYPTCALVRFRFKKEAIDRFDRMLEINPKDVNFYFSEGEKIRINFRKFGIYKMQTKLAEAISFYEKALQINPEHESTLWGIGYSAFLIWEINYYKGLVFINEVNHLCKGSRSDIIDFEWGESGGIPNLLAGEVHAEFTDEQVKNYSEKAINVFQKLINIREKKYLPPKKKSILYNNLGCAYINYASISTDEDWAWEKAYEILNKATEINPKDVVAWENRSYSSAILGKSYEIDNEIERLDTLLDSDKENADLWLSKGIIFYASQNGDLSVFLDSGKEKENADSWLSKGIIFDASEHKAEAAVVFLERATNLNPNDPIGFELKASALARLERYEGALEAIKKVIELTPQNRDILFDKANVLIKLGRHEEALEIIDDIIKFFPENDSAFINKARILSKLGRYGEAYEAYEKAIKLNPAIELAFGRLMRQ
jgi:tetratricopeptide (TPR) repeat protein